MQLYFKPAVSVLNPKHESLGLECTLRRARALWSHFLHLVAELPFKKMHCGHPSKFTAKPLPALHSA